MKVSKLRHWKQADQGWVRDMDNACFPTDESFSNSKNYHWWVVYQLSAEMTKGVKGRFKRPYTKAAAVGYAAIYIDDNGVCHFTRCGVLPQHRGKGVQKMLIKARLKWCKKTGIQTVRTYTDKTNPHSERNLLDAGFRRRRGDKWVYFTKEIA